TSGGGGRGRRLVGGRRSPGAVGGTVGRPGGPGAPARPGGRRPVQWCSSGCAEAARRGAAGRGGAGRRRRGAGGTSRPTRAPAGPGLGGRGSGRAGDPAAFVTVPRAGE